MKKVLHIGIDSKNFGGIEQLVLEYAKHINKNNNFKIDVLSQSKDNYLFFENELKQACSKLYAFNINKLTRKTELIYDYKLFKFLRKNEYDILHVNSRGFFWSFKVILIAKLCGIKTIIIHTHGVIKVREKIKQVVFNIINPLFRSMIDKHLACSKLAGISLYTENFLKKNELEVLPNGIYVREYIYNENDRRQYRNMLNINENIVYGHIGRFQKTKNHNQLIDIFYEIQERQKNSVLILIGDGELMGEIQNKVKNLNIHDKVIFLGFREDVNKILNAIDYFIFPSFNEGLGIALIEAQTNGIPVFCSDTIPPEAKISEKFYTFNLNENCAEIADKICAKKLDLEYRKTAYQNAISKGYDINDVCQRLEEIYSETCKEVNHE